MSLRLKLTVIFLAVALIPILFVSVVTFNNYKSSLEAARLSELEHLISIKAERIGAYFSELKFFVEFARNAYVVRKYTPVINSLVGEPANPEFITAKGILDNLLQNPQKALKLSDVLLVNPEGKVLYASDLRHYQAEFPRPLSEFEEKAAAEGKDKAYFSDMFLKESEGQEPVPEMLITAHINNFEGDFIGIIIAEVDMRPVYSLIQDTAGMGRTGEVLVGKKTGNEVVFLNPLRHDPKGTFARRITIGEKIGLGLQQAAQGKTGSGRTIDYREKNVIAAWSYIPSVGWGIVAKIDSDEAFSDVENLKHLVWVILIIVMVLGGITAFSISQSIAGPIKKLSRGAEIIGGGNLDYKIGTDLKDEVGQLSRAFDKMAADLKATAVSRDIERKRLYDLLELLPVYVVLLDKDYRVPFANKFFRERFGESRGRRCYEYLFNRTAECEGCQTYKVMKTRAPHHWEWTGPDNRNYDIYDFPFTDSDGSMMIMEMGIDITERKQAEAALKSAQSEIDKARRLSDIGTLAATIAHELRNPLAAMSMAAANIKRKANNPGLDKHLMNIEKKISESDQIINNLLFYSRIKPPTYENVNLYNIIEECIDSAGEKAKKNAAFENGASGIKDLSIMADPTQIKEVMNNILNNAIDAVPEDKGTVRVKAEDEGDYVAVGVTDNGAGIAKDHLDRIFDPFFTTKAKGTGLGLSVCRQIVDFHGGSIDIKSEPGEGTTVMVRLPKDGKYHE